MEILPSQNGVLLITKNFLGSFRDFLRDFPIPSGHFLIFGRTATVNRIMIARGLVLAQKKPTSGKH